MRLETWLLRWGQCKNKGSQLVGQEGLGSCCWWHRFVCGSAKHLKKPKESLAAGCSGLGAGRPRSVLWGCPGGPGQAASAFCTVGCSLLPGSWVFKRRWGIGLKDGGKPGLKTGGFIIAIHLWSFIAEKLSLPIRFHFLCAYWSSSCRVQVCDVLMCWGPNECERCLICLLAEIVVVFFPFFLLL